VSQTNLKIALSLLMPIAARAAEPTPPIEVRLFEALWQKGNQPVKGGPTLIVFLARDGEHWDRAVGVAGSFNPMLHVGLVEQARVSDQAMDLTLGMDIVGDSYVPGGRGDYKVSLKAGANGVFAGTYAGTFRGVAVQGRAEGRVLPPAKTIPGASPPIAAGEHPRILFRKSDLPALREKAKTPFGQAVLAKATDPIGLGIQYQITGDKKYAEQAREAVDRLIDHKYGATPTPGSHHGLFHWGWTWENPAVAYDLCYDAWDDAFKKRVERFVTLWAERILWQRGMFNTQGQYSYGNGEASSLYYGVSLGALTFLGEKGPEPAKPVAPDPIVDVPPAKDYKPGKDVPVVPLSAPISPAKWLATPAIRAWIADDPLKALGGAAACRPEAGTAFSFEGASYEFKPLDPKFVPERGGIYLNVGKSLSPGHVKRGPGPEIAREGPITLCLYTVLDNAEPQWVKVNAGFTRFGYQQFVLAGHTLMHGQVVKLDKGLYPLLVIMRVKARWDTLTPGFDAAGEKDVEASKATMARYQQQYANDLKQWEYDAAAWKRSGGTDQDFRRLFEITRYMMYLSCRESVGTGGAQPVTSAESYEVGLHPALYAAAYRVCFNKDLSPFGDITHALPRRIFAHIYPESGAPFSQEIHGPNAVQMDFFAYNFPLVPEPWKPAVLWAWHRHAGVTGAAGPADAVKLIGPAKWYTPPRAFVNYPLGLEPKPPQGIFPLTWEAPDFGYYGFRNGWKGKDDFLVQVWLKSGVSKGYAMPNAGTFRILGLGHEWVIGYPSVRLDNKRYFDPVVLFPEDGINDDGEAHAMYVKMEPDGSGALTADLREVYCKKLDYEKYGNIARETTFQDSGITGLRAYAVDYSGACGAPCLFVLVDKITGGKSKVWPWYLAGVSFDGQTGKVSGTGEDFKKTKVEGNGVTVSKDDGTTMRMTFAGPANPVVKAEVRTLKFQQTYNRGEASFTAPGIFASGADPTDGNFFVIVTIQKGPAPQVKIEGKGLEAKATVGNRRIAFDGRKIVMTAAGQ
jgi:hypothetical protein